ncbi:MAG: hypothetical protein C4339_04375 [Nitrososphaerota archaeon]
MGAERLGKGLYLIDTVAVGARGTVAAYLILGRKRALVDCGHASSLPTLLEGLREAGLRPEELDYIIPTHVHLDHAGAAGALARLAANALVVAHSRAKPHLVDPSKLIRSATQLFGEQLMKAYGLPEPIEEARVQAFDRELSVDLGGGLELRLLYAPGHAPHQLVAYIERERILLTADSVGILYPDFPRAMIPTTPPPSFDPALAMRTAQELSQLPAVKLLLPHFGPREDVAWVWSETERGIESWARVAERTLEDGKGPEAILDRITGDFLKRAGVAEPARLPAYVRVSLWTSAMGLYTYYTKDKSPARAGRP